MVNS